jgi:lipopolysaccharide transport system permease protein
MIRWALRSLARHWDLLSQMVVTDLRGRYVGSSLGLVWTVIHPLAMIMIFTLVFSKVMATRLGGSDDPYAYSIYLCAALLPWIAFQELVSRATTLFPDNANLVRKVAFPKVILYGALALSSAVHLLLAIAIFVLVLVVAGHAFPPTLALWLPLAALQLGFGLGLAMITSVLHVFVRDTAQLVSVGLQVAFWATPIVYVEDILPPWLRSAEGLNPLYLFSRAHRAVVTGALPSPGAAAALVAITVAVLAAGAGLYRRFRADILDEL